MKLYTEEQVRKAWNTAYADALSLDDENYKPKFYSDFIASLTPIQLPSDEEIDEKFNDFLQKELEIGISDKATIERIEWYYNTYFKRHKIKGGQDNE